MTPNIESYYRTYGPMVLRRCRYLLRNEEDALDAMQEVFVQLLRNGHRLKHQAPSSLLHVIATNTCLNRIRSQQRRPESSDTDWIASMASLDDPEERISVRQILGKLLNAERPSTRTMAVMHLLDGMTLEEVARETGMSTSGVRKRLEQLRKHGASLKGPDHER